MGCLCRVAAAAGEGVGVVAVRSKTGTARLDHQAGTPKTTRQGYGQRSRPRRRGKKPLRGQGR